MISYIHMGANPWCSLILIPLFPNLSCWSLQFFNWISLLKPQNIKTENNILQQPFCLSGEECPTHGKQTDTLWVNGVTVWGGDTSSPGFTTVFWKRNASTQAQLPRNSPAVISCFFTSVSLLPWPIRNKEQLTQERIRSLIFSSSEKKISEREIKQKSVNS